MTFMQNSVHSIGPLGKKQAGLHGDTFLVVKVAVWSSAQMCTIKIVFVHIMFFGYPRKLFPSKNYGFF